MNSRKRHTILGKEMVAEKQRKTGLLGDDGTPWVTDASGNQIQLPAAPSGKSYLLYENVWILAPTDWVNGGSQAFVQGTNPVTGKVEWQLAAPGMGGAARGKHFGEPVYQVSAYGGGMFQRVKQNAPSETDRRTMESLKAALAANARSSTAPTAPSMPTSTTPATDLAKRGAVAATAAGAHCGAVAASWQSAVAMMVMLLVLATLIHFLIRAIKWQRARRGANAVPEPGKTGVIPAYSGLAIRTP